MEQLCCTTTQQSLVVVRNLEMEQAQTFWAQFQLELWKPSPVEPQAFKIFQLSLLWA